jgi:hypothetical protein
LFVIWILSDLFLVHSWNYFDNLWIMWLFGYIWDYTHGYR